MMFHTNFAFQATSFNTRLKSVFSGNNNSMMAVKDVVLCLTSFSIIARARPTARVVSRVFYLPVLFGRKTLPWPSKKKQNKTFIITHLKRNKKKRDSLAPTISQQTILWSRLFCGEGQAKQLHRGDLTRLNDPWWLTYPK